MPLAVASDTWRKDTAIVACLILLAEGLDF